RPANSEAPNELHPVPQGVETRAVLEPHTTGRVPPAGLRAGDDDHVPTAPRQVFRDAAPAQPTGGAVVTEVIRDDEKPAVVAHGAVGHACCKGNTSPAAAGQRSCGAP